MPRFQVLLLASLLFVTAAVSSAQNKPDTRLRVASPNGQIVFILSDAAHSRAMDAASNDLRYAVDFHGKWLIDESNLGLKIEGQAPLGPGMKQVDAHAGQHDETYTIPVGKTSSVRDHYNSSFVDLTDESGRKLSLEIRAFDDGVAFRYVVPKQAGLQTLRIEHELTQFAYNNDATLYPLVVDGFQTPYEDEYLERPVSGIHRDWLIGLPLLSQVPGVGWVAVTEANIDNYAGMYLRKDKGTFSLHAELSPRIDQPAIAVEDQAPGDEPVAGADDRRSARPPGGIEHDSQSQSALEDCRYVVDSCRQVSVGLVVRGFSSQHEDEAGDEHCDHEALHRLRVGFRVSLHADRCRVGAGRYKCTA